MKMSIALSIVSQHKNAQVTSVNIPRPAQVQRAGPARAWLLPPLTDVGAQGRHAASELAWLGRGFLCAGVPGFAATGLFQSCPASPTSPPLILSEA